MRIRTVTVEQMIKDYDDRGAMLVAFRHAANRIGVEAGITKDHVSHDEAAASVCGDNYYLDLIRGAEQRMGLERISFEHQQTLLSSCEKALADRDEKMTELEDSLFETDRAYRRLLSGLPVRNADEIISRAASLLPKPNEDMS